MVAQIVGILLVVVLRALDGAVVRRGQSWEGGQVRSWRAGARRVSNASLGERRASIVVQVERRAIVDLERDLVGQLDVPGDARAFVGANRRVIGTDAELKRGLARDGRGVYQRDALLEQAAEDVNTEP